MSSASEASHSRLRPPAILSTRSEEPTFTTMRRKSESAGIWRDILLVRESQAGGGRCCIRGAMRL